VSRLVLAALLLAACGGGGEPDVVPEKLSGWGLFSDARAQLPADGVEPYELNAPLFSDGAVKHRFFRLPEGGKIGVAADGRWEFPAGTVLVKTFGFGERLVETRLLVNEAGSWQAYVYQWDGDDATLTQVGARVPVSTMGREITYRVPNRVQCENCHGGTGAVRPLGPRTPQLERAGQIDDFVARGFFSAPPADRTAYPDPMDASAPLEARARAYLDANCAHCHRDGGAAQQSGLWLNREMTDPLRIGICKPPVAAGRGTGGRKVAIMPGNPDASILIFRVSSEEAGVKMPELPAVLSHPEGVALLREWIAAMPPDDCGL